MQTLIEFNSCFDPRTRKRVCGDDASDLADCLSVSTKRGIMAQYSYHHIDAVYLNFVHLNS